MQLKIAEGKTTALQTPPKAKQSSLAYYGELGRIEPVEFRATKPQKIPRLRIVNAPPKVSPL